MSVQEFAKAEWQQFLQSKTLKVVIAAEAAVLTDFTADVLKNGITLPGLRVLFIALVAGAIVATIRHAVAGLEAKLDGAVDPKTVAQLEEAGKTKLLEALGQRSPELRAAVERETK